MTYNNRNMVKKQAKLLYWIVCVSHWVTTRLYFKPYPIYTFYQWVPKTFQEHGIRGIQLFPDITETFNIFDSKMSYILLYGAELWGMTSHRYTEQVQMYACKRVLGANQNACNDAILADLGRFPMFIYSARRSIKFWLRIFVFTKWQVP